MEKRKVCKFLSGIRLLNILILTKSMDEIAAVLALRQNLNSACLVFFACLVQDPFSERGSAPLSFFYLHIEVARRCIV